MIKIDEVCGILGLPADTAGKSKAREVLNYFGVRAETPAKVEGQFGAVAKLYSKEEVEMIAAFKLASFGDS